MPEIIALVPMRHHSERVPGKNYRPFAGRPLYHHIIVTLRACPQIDKIVIDTDSPTIMEDTAQHFPEVVLVERPAHLRAGTMPMNNVLLHDTSLFDADYYLQTHSTNPLLKPETINRALEQFLQNHPMYDSMFAVTRWQTRLWDQLGRAINHNEAILLRTQDLPPVYEENSNFYLFTRQTLAEEGSRIGRRPMLFEVERLEAWDIDEEIDFRIAEFLYLEREEKGGKV